MERFPFLSPEWIEAARAIAAVHRERLPSPTEEVRVNLVVTEVPFADGELLAHLAAQPGLVEVDLGALDSPDVTVTLDYETTRAIFVEGNAQAGMQAFMAGRVRVDGDIGRLMAVFGMGGAPDPMAGDIGAELRAITEGVD